MTVQFWVKFHQTTFKTKFLQSLRTLMEFSVPECVRVTPLAPIALLGLDYNPETGQGSHGDIGRAFSAERSPDRLPLRFIHLNNNIAFPPAKQKRSSNSSYDWFIPKGILKTNWMAKHLDHLPAVVVIFFQLDWTDPDWNEKKMECSAKVESVRSTLSAR